MSDEVEDWTLITSSEVEMDMADKQMQNTDGIGMSLVEGVEGDYSSSPLREREPGLNVVEEGEIESLQMEIERLQAQLKDQQIVAKLQEKENAALSRQLSQKQSQFEERLALIEQETERVKGDKRALESDRRALQGKIDRLEVTLRERDEAEEERLKRLREEETESLSWAQEVQTSLERRTTNLRSTLISSIVQIKECLSLLEEENRRLSPPSSSPSSSSSLHREVDDEDLSLEADDTIADLQRQLLCQLADEADAFVQYSGALAAQLHQLEKQVEELTEEKNAGGVREGKEEEGAPNLKISTRDFEDGDVMIFFPLYNNFIAFNIDCPHHYLSHESKEMVGSHPLFKKSFVVGKMVFKETHTASEDFNPFNLRVGTEFSIVTLRTL